VAAAETNQAFDGAGIATNDATEHIANVGIAEEMGGLLGCEAKFLKGMEQVGSGGSTAINGVSVAVMDNGGTAAIGISSDALSAARGCCQWEDENSQDTASNQLKAGRRGRHNNLRR